MRDYVYQTDIYGPIDKGGHSDLATAYQRLAPTMAKSELVTETTFSLPLNA